MNAQDVITVSAAVVALTQLIKWGGVSSKHGPMLVLLLSAFGVAMWAWSQPSLPARSDFFEYFAGWIGVSTSAAGVFGFTRATRESVASSSSPPSGAGNSQVVDSKGDMQ